MSDFKTVPLTHRMLDPHKRVNYTMGLVLGVDEFQQEQTYFTERDRLHNRALHGYGTVNGLQLSVHIAGADGPEVVVSAGMAINPQGQHICVPVAQCAKLNAWLNREQGRVWEELGSPPTGRISAYVLLCYRECGVDQVPVPGGPCRSQSDSVVPSRISDDFELKLSFDPPPQLEENAIRRFGELLARIVVVPGGDVTTEAELLDYVRAIATEAGPDLPPLDEAWELASPPLDPYLRLDSETAGATLHAAFRVWTTEVRPQVLRRDLCGSLPEGEACVLLGELQFDIVNNGAGSLRVADDIDGGTGVTIIETARPILLSTRVLQEWMAHGSGGQGAVDGLSLGELIDVDILNTPQTSQVLTWTGSAWEPQDLPTDAPAEALTRVVGMSWRHGESVRRLANVRMADGMEQGLVVFFGKDRLGDDGAVEVRTGSLDEDTFQVLVQDPEELGFWSYRAIRPRAVIPVEPEMASENMILTVRQVDGPRASAAAFVIAEETLDTIQNSKFYVTIKGDFVVDETGARAIDARHFAALERRPTGVQGGRFESWFRLIGEPINLNTATVEELRGLPRVGPALAERIVARREEVGSFSSIEDLIDVQGIRRSLLNVLRPFVRV